MAQKTGGIRLYWGESTDGIAAPTTWTEIPDVTSTPAIGGEPNMLDATPLSETENKQYIPGLKDPGGSMAFGVMFTPEMLTATDAASTAVISPKKRAFAIEIPAPVNCYYWYFGEGIAVTPGETEVDGVLSSTFYTSIASNFKKVTGKVSGGE